MNDIETTDRTGQLPTQAEFDEAIKVVGKYLVHGITELPPELGVSMAVILRCLQAGKAIFKQLAESKT